MTIRRSRMLRAAALVAFAAAVTTGNAGAVTPVNGGDAGGTTIAVNNGPGDQSEPHVSGDLAVYTSREGVESGIRYHDLASGADLVVPRSAPIPGALWVWAPGVTGATSPADLAQFFFSKTFTLATTPTAATLQVAVDNFAEVRVNGTVVGTTGSTTDFAAAIASQNSRKAFDIAPYLTAGANTITIRAQNATGFGACSPCAYHENPAGVVFGGSITAGVTLTLASDPSWQVFDVDPATPGATALGSAETFCLNATNPDNCPVGATLYGFQGAGWTATTPFSLDFLSDVSANRIVFSRLYFDGTTGVVLFDALSGVQRELDPQPGSTRFGAVVGGDTVAYAEFAGGTGDIFAYDLAAGTVTTLTQSPATDYNPNVAPTGDVVVWEQCAGSDCDVYQSVRSAGTWGSPTAVGTTTSNESNPDTDGTTVVYDSFRPSPTDADIYLRPLSGGPEVPLQLAGVQRNPSISNGVIAFESVIDPQLGSADVYVYVIATNTLFRVTNTPTVNESLNDVSVLPNGTVRLVWATDDDVVLGDHNVFARTFALPAADSTPPAITPTVMGTPGANGWYTSDVGLSWTVSEPDSPGSLVKTGCADQSITADQAPTIYSCSASSSGGSAGTVNVSIKRDATPPTLTFSGNAGTYTVAQTVAIGCAATDNLSGIATDCSGVNAAASTFPLGAKTITRSATDKAGNTGTASTSFAVVVDSPSLCALTRQFVQSSVRYQALGSAAKRVVDGSVSAACAFLTRIGPQLLPAQKTAFIKAYKDAVQALAGTGWLTGLQATTLKTLADNL